MIVIFILQFLSSNAATISRFHSLPDGTTLVSKDGTFELGFFSPGSSINRYVGIWFKKIPQKTIVWVANRDNPINSNSSKLTITKDGNLVILSNNNNTVHWSINTTKTKAIKVVAQLLDSGNFVLRDENDTNPENYMWQSFDHPSDTLLPGMKLGWEATNDVNLNRYLTAWNNWDDPSSANFTYSLARSSNPETQIWNGSSMIYRSGTWNGIRLSGVPSLRRVPLFSVNFVSNTNEGYFQFYPRNKSLISRIILNQTVYSLQRFIWDEGSEKWKLYLTVLRDDCDRYNLCGSFGYCVMMDVSPVCKCLSGFEPKSPQKWAAKNWTQGCVLSSKSWSCRVRNKDGFSVFNNMKVPDTNTSLINRSMTLEECKDKCWENCSCTAYGNSDIIGNGSGCILWFGDLLDLRQIPDAGQDLYIRLDISKLGNEDAKGGSRKVVDVVASIVSSISFAMLVIITLVYRRSKIKFRETEITKTKVTINESKEEDLELPFFDFDTISRATNDFSSDNKLSQGGFGPVYKGTLPDGQVIAVKRLSHTSTQGLTEFKNEVILCSKLQHRNLVKVLGYYIEEHEKLLIYEYMSNKSLDFFLFDSSQSRHLDWSKRFNIINGIARGLLYLHQDSRLRIIHRDLKASNILLDNDMNPKISDFGLARMCRGDQIEGNTSRIVGTYGYMAPEYAIDGVFSTKSDVYSFGILLLEILSGKRNKGFSYSNNNYNLIGHAWRLWKECIPNEFIDTCLGDSYILSEALRCIQIGLSCVQHQPNDRPNMTSVVVMLTRESALSKPKEPFFLTQRVSVEEHFGQTVCCSTNEVTITKMEPR